VSDQTVNKALFFTCSNGVKQGETLSPLLFNIFINDLPVNLVEMINTELHIPSLNGRSIDHLLYAADLIILSKTAEGLQSMLSQLEGFCAKWKLEINVKKTKVMKISGNGHICKDSFFFKGTMLENCKSYKYLGIVLSSLGSFTNAKINAANKAKKALFNIRACLRNTGINPRLGLNLFDKTYFTNLYIWC
jgi:hypothetical protein